ncbi:MAG: serine hydrolase domain-containing protein [Parvularculaceae bacterium]
MFSLKAAFVLAALWSTTTSSAIAADGAAHAAENNTDIVIRADDVLNDRVDGTKTYFGVAAAFVDGKSTAYYFNGNTDGARSHSVTPDTHFEIGSLTKVFTASLLSDMVRRGEVKYSDRISDLVPDGFPISEDLRDITLAQLVTHTSGLPRRPDNLPKEAEAGPYADYGTADLLDYLKTAKTVTPPGTAYSYSNLGMGLVGALLSLNAGKTYAQLLKERILDPLKMKSTSACVSEDCGDFAWPHDILGAETAPWTFDALAGAGALRSTAADMKRFIRAALGDAHGFAAKSIQATMTSQLSINPLDKEYFPAWVKPYSKNGVTIFWHDGGTGGSRSVLAIDRDHHRGVFVVANTANSVVDVALNALDPAYSLRKFELLKKTPLSTNEKLVDYVGDYNVGGEKLHISTADDKLYAQFEGDIAVEVTHYNRGRFFYTIADAQLHFTRDDDGAVSGVVFILEGDKSDGEKIEVR